MLKTVVVFQTVVVGSVSVLLALMSQPPARAQVTASVAIPSLPAAPVSTSTDVQQLPQVADVHREIFRGFKLGDNAPSDTTQANAEVAKADALANVLKALKEAQSKIDCTFALKMMEVDPNVDSRIRVGAPDGGRARIRRILPPACLK